MSHLTDGTLSAPDVPVMLIVRIPVGAADRKGATDANCTRITSIDVYDSLGYCGCAHEEHSGTSAAAPADGLGDRLADNRARQLVRGEH